MELDEKTKKQRRNTIIWIISLAVVVLALAGLLIWQMKRLNEAKIAANASPMPTVTVTQTASKTATKTATITPTATPTSTASEGSTTQARAAADGFLTAYVSRNLTEAKPFMTDAFYATWTQDGFAGTSSPGRLNYQIVDLTTVADRWEVQAKVNLTLSGEDAGYESWQLDVVLEGEKHLVNAMNAASF